MTAALIVDVQLPDGCGLSVAEHARLRAPGLPVLVITGEASPEVSHRAFALDAPMLLKPFSPLMLSRFIERATECAACMAHDPDVHFERYIVQAGLKLSKRERQTLTMAMVGMDRYEIASRLGLASSTIKTLTSRLLHKTGQRSLARLVAAIWTQSG